MKFSAPELAHQFHVRLHVRTRKLIEALDVWSEENGLPSVVVTSISRDPNFYKEPRFSYHLVDCAADLRTHHYSAEQLAQVRAWLEAQCASAEWELICEPHGTGPHFHVAWRAFGLRRRWEKEHPRKEAQA